MTSLLGNIDSIREEFLRERFIKELESLKQDKDMIVETNLDEDNSENSDNELNWVDKRIQMLELIVSKYDDSIKITDSKYKEKNKTLNDELDDISNLIFKKAWNRLPNYHKIIKINEYITGLIKDKKIMKEVINKLTELVNSKKLNSLKHVNYDSTKCTIISISVLKYDPKTNEYEIKN